MRDERTRNDDRRTHRAQRPREVLRVGDVMHRGIVSCARGSTACEIAQLMISEGVHCVAVRSPSPEPGHPPLIWGIVTDLNLLRALAEGNSDATAETLAGGQVIRVRPTQTISEAADVMVRSGAHHVVVIDPDDLQPIGMLSTTDIASRSHPEAERMLTALTDEECRQLLAANHLGRLAVTLPSGRPLIRPVNYVFDQRRSPSCSAAAPGSKQYALTHAPRACFEIDDGAGGATGAWSVIIVGSTEIVSRPSEIERLERLGLDTWGSGRTCAGFAFTPTRSPAGDWPEPERADRSGRR